MTSNRISSARIEARVPAAEKALFQQAADLVGSSLTDFLTRAAHNEAMKVITEHEQITLSQRDSEIFVNALLNPREPNSKLKKAAKHYKEDVISK